MSAGILYYTKLNPNANLKYEILCCLKFPSLWYFMPSAHSTDDHVALLPVTKVACLVCGMI